jgi:glycine/D-amino acid oxidase-like deaminating enzyme
VAPSLSSRIRSTGQPVVHFAPVDSAPFDAKRFPVFTADISRTGYYGFPVNRDGLLKIANHGIGRAMHPESEARVVTDEETAAMRTFFDSALSGLRDARIAATRVCVYGDTTDQHFIIAPDPDRPGLVVAAGGSGHGFKFAPILGDLVADALENKVVPKFRWRDPDPNRRGEERSRHQG